MAGREKVDGWGRCDNGEESEGRGSKGSSASMDTSRWAFLRTLSLKLRKVVGKVS